MENSILDELGDNDNFCIELPKFKELNPTETQYWYKRYKSIVSSRKVNKLNSTPIARLLYSDLLDSTDSDGIWRGSKDDLNYFKLGKRNSSTTSKVHLLKILEQIGLVTITRDRVRIRKKDFNKYFKKEEESSDDIKNKILSPKTQQPKVEIEKPTIAFQQPHVIKIWNSIPYELFKKIKWNPGIKKFEYLKDVIIEGLNFKEYLLGFYKEETINSVINKVIGKHTEEGTMIGILNILNWFDSISPNTIALVEKEFPIDDFLN